MKLAGDGKFDSRGVINFHNTETFCEMRIQIFLVFHTFILILLYLYFYVSYFLYLYRVQCILLYLQCDGPGEFESSGTLGG